jgi:hypothetical protein
LPFDGAQGTPSAVEGCERRVSRVSRESEPKGRNPRQLAELPHAADRTRGELSRGVERFAQQLVSGLFSAIESPKGIQHCEGWPAGAPVERLCAPPW